MPTPSEELENWFKERPSWLQDAARRLMEKGYLEDEDADELLRICGTEAGMEFDEETIPEPQPIPTGSFKEEDHTHKIEISSISNIVGVNALNPRTPLTIADGLTVIYGQNGSGKSGYTRLLKQVCGAKQTGQLHPNAFADLPASQSCKITYKYEEKDYELNWDISHGVHERLSAVELYDSECGYVYVTSENQLAYEPPILRIFTELSDTSDILSERFNELNKSLVSAKPILPIQYSLTESGKWYIRLTAETSEANIDEMCAWNEKNQQDLDALNTRLKSPDPSVQAAVVKRSNVQASRLLIGFRRWESLLNEDGCSKYLASKKDHIEKQKLSVDYAKSVFENSPLSGIGEDAWNKLWEQARQYSQQVSYKDEAFPNVDSDAVCVLCQQPLDEAAKNRLTNFEEFVKGELESETKTAKEVLDNIEDSLKSPPSEETIDSMIAGADIDNPLALIFQTLRENIVKNSEELLKVDTDSQFISGIDFTVLDELVTLIQNNDAIEAQLIEDAKADNRDEIQKEAKELEAKLWVSQQKAAAINEISLLKKEAKIASAKTLVNTSALTRKKTALTKELITEEYLQRFDNEIDALGAGRINVKLEKTSSDKGKVFFQITLEDNQLGLPVDSILSEGELRVISLAAFLADVKGHADNSTFIFDDPISSLDQDYEEKVAARLAELSKTRQVLVFTHRLSLMVLLEEALKKKGLTQNIIGLYKETWGSGEPGVPPIQAQNTRAAINTLIGKIPEGRNILDTQGSENYSWWAKMICGNIRITLEKVIEFDMMSDVVQRFRRPIITKDKIQNLAKISTPDCEYIDRLMTKYSRYEHSQPVEAPVQMPEPDELETDLTQLRDWRKEFSDRSVD